MQYFNALSEFELINRNRHIENIGFCMNQYDEVGYNSFIGLGYYQTQLAKRLGDCSSLPCTRLQVQNSMPYKIL